MSKLKVILELIKLLQPVLAEAWPYIKQIIDLLKGKDAPLVGAGTPPSHVEVEEGVKSLVAAGVPEAEAKEALTV